MCADLLNEADGDLHGDDLALLDVAVDELRQLRARVAGGRMGTRRVSRAAGERCQGRRGWDGP